MKEIEANKVKLVVVVGKLLEGFDHPPISIAAILTKTGSPVKFIGRAQNLSHSYKRRKHCWITYCYVEFLQQQENYRKFKNESFIKIWNEKVEN